MVIDGKTDVASEGHVRFFELSFELECYLSADINFTSLAPPRLMLAFSEEGATNLIFRVNIRHSFSRKGRIEVAVGEPYRKNGPSELSFVGRPP